MSQITWNAREIKWSWEKFSIKIYSFIIIFGYDIKFLLGKTASWQKCPFMSFTILIDPFHSFFLGWNLVKTERSWKENVIKRESRVYCHWGQRVKIQLFQNAVFEKLLSFRFCHLVSLQQQTSSITFLFYFLICNTGIRIRYLSQLL